MTPITAFRRKTVVVLGLGPSGTAAALALAAGGARVQAWDEDAGARDAAAAAGVEITEPAAFTWRRTWALVVAADRRATVERHWIEAARAARVPVIGDLDLVVRERKRLAPTAPLTAIIQSRATPLATSLLAHILTSDNRDVEVVTAGILDGLRPLERDRFYIMPVALDELAFTPTLFPSVAVLMGLESDTDGDGNGAAAAARFLANAEQCCASVDEEPARTIAARQQERGYVHEFSTAADFAAGYHVAEGRLRCDMSEVGMAEELADLAGVRALSTSDGMAAAAAVAAALGALGAVLAMARWMPIPRRDMSLRRRLFEAESDFVARYQSGRSARPSTPDAIKRRREALNRAFASFTAAD